MKTLLLILFTLSISCIAQDVAKIETELARRTTDALKPVETWYEGEMTKAAQMLEKAGKTKEAAALWEKMILRKIDGKQFTWEETGGKSTTISFFKHEAPMAAGLNHWEAIGPDSILITRDGDKAKCTVKFSANYTKLATDYAFDKAVKVTGTVKPPK